jgi:broad specificity phosphatase PhoE
MRLILVRHGETSWNREGRIQGHSQEALNDRGLCQAEALADSLSCESPIVVYTSPLKRSIGTAEAIARSWNLKPKVLNALMEADAGELDGMPVNEMAGRYPEFMARWRSDPSTSVMPGGEALIQVQDRVWTCIQKLHKKHQSKTVIAVSHNFAILSLLCRALDIPLKYFGRFKLNLGSYSVLEFQEQRIVLLHHNNHSHQKNNHHPPGE